MSNILYIFNNGNKSKLMFILGSYARIWLEERVVAGTVPFKLENVFFFFVVGITICVFNVPHTTEKAIIRTYYRS